MTKQAKKTPVGTSLDPDWLDRMLETDNTVATTDDSAESAEPEEIPAQEISS